MVKGDYFIAGIILLVLTQACAERVICPAYQSAFIHDKKALEQQFSYFGQDTMPKVMEASKDKFLIIEPMAYRKKLMSLQTIPMRDVYPQKEEDEFDDDFYLAEGGGYDSSAVISVDTLNGAAADSIYVISLKKENFNIDQELYLWYLRDHLVYPDVRLQRQQVAAQKKRDEKEERKNKGISGFFRNLFKKKNKSDTTIFDVETSATELDETETKEKKGLFDFLKKKNKKQPAKEEQDGNAAPPPPGENDVGDDF